jgi:hypothetical protein
MSQAIAIPIELPTGAEIEAEINYSVTEGEPDHHDGNTFIQGCDDEIEILSVTWTNHESVIRDVSWLPVDWELLVTENLE